LGALEFRRADNMWANWGRPDGFLGTETITLQPGQKKIFATDWAYEKQRNDRANFYGSHLRHAVNRGAGSVHVRLRGPGQFVVRPANPVSTALAILLPGMGSVQGAFLKSANDAGSSGSTRLQPGETSLYRHDTGSDDRRSARVRDHAPRRGARAVPLCARHDWWHP
jgi:hypothetical protein